MLDESLTARRNLFIVWLNQSLIDIVESILQVLGLPLMKLLRD
jgi:hypothetical protein